MESVLFFLLIIFVIALVVYIHRYNVEEQKAKKAKNELAKLKSEFAEFKKHTEHLRQYEQIDDAKLESERIVKKAKSYQIKAVEQIKEKVAKAKQELANKLKETRIKARDIRSKAEKTLKEAHELATKIENEANQKAQEIAGEAWAAKQNADQYEATVKAMKNIIKGYGDEYLIPNESLLDELAADYDHKQAGRDLSKIRLQIKSMIKNNEAADCDYVDPHRKSRAIEFVLDAFNGKVDSIMSKVKHDNYGKLLQQLEDAFRLVNHNGIPFRNARITERYYEVMVQQLNAAVAVQTLRKQEQEEQRRIKAEMREEERARREYEKAIKEAEKEERLIQKAMKEAESKLASAAAEEKAKFEEQLAELKEKLWEAEEKEQRAISMAQQTKQGHVYVISNIGSFGEDIFKIGLTRRLEPFDRVRELGDASVPFSFDIHAMVYSEDAPKLEKTLHDTFNENHVNKVNPRKEFFRIPLSSIRTEVDKLGLETHWTMKAEALEYRESIQLENNITDQKAQAIS